MRHKESFDAILWFVVPGIIKVFDLCYVGKLPGKED